ncbi:MAG TPA: DNA-processing protein DprA [Alphaproteobacteria bacterium]|jgi:DNA processing protein
MDPRVARPLTEAEKLDWLCLSRSERVGPITFHHLIRRFGSARAALDALPELARRGGKSLKPWPRAAAERELAAIAAAGARLIAAVEPDYPAPLAAVEDAPPLLTVKGDPAVLLKPAVAVVGARNASANGRRMARDLARDLGAAGLVVVSGLARGIDAAAHEGALATGTVAVLAGGIDVPYPPENQPLCERIMAEGGAAVAEMPPGTEPKAQHFPRRNRVIAGLALGVVVVEAALRSGSLITARLALDQGREVFSVPGSPLDPRCHGTNNLLRQGAVLTESAEDVLRVVAAQAGASIHPGQKPYFIAESEDYGPSLESAPTAETARLAVLGALSPSPIAVDELARQCQLPAAEVASVLLELELAGRIDRHPGHKVSLTIA